MCSRKACLKLHKSLKVRKDELNAKLARNESISSSDEHWLDHEGNIIDEQHVRTSTSTAIDDNDGPDEPRPTRRDVLKAASTIGKYTNDMKYRLARKMEALLGSFNRLLRLEEARGLKDAHLTDFFDRS
jgi:hypothetical protein